MREAVADIVADAPRILPVTDIPQTTDSDLLTAYPIGDAHIGMLSWGEESGKDWDLKIAESVFGKVFDRLVDNAPQSERARIIDVGDFLHSDNMAGVTTGHGNVLDMDSRYGKVLRCGVRIMRRMIARALEKHKYVDVDIVKGNHNDIGALWMATLLANTYENEPRVWIEQSPRMFHYYQFGKNLLGSTHGHTVKAAKLPLIMATDVPKMWGDTIYRDWHTGHIHHDTVKDETGCRVLSHRTLAGEEAYADAAGYRSGQSSQFFVYHKEYGPIWTRKVDIREVHDL
jgi:hypothetical protein